MIALSYYVIYTPHITTACFLIMFFASLFLGTPRADIGSSLVKGFTASTIPTGVALVVCAFNLELIAKLEDLGFYVGVAGATVVAVATKELLGW